MPIILELSRLIYLRRVPETGQGDDNSPYRARLAKSKTPITASVMTSPPKPYFEKFEKIRIEGARVLKAILQVGCCASRLMISPCRKT